MNTHSNLQPDGVGPGLVCADCGAPANTWSGRAPLCFACDEDPARGYLARLARTRAAKRIEPAPEDQPPPAALVVAPLAPEKRPRSRKAAKPHPAKRTPLKVPSPEPEALEADASPAPKKRAKKTPETEEQKLQRRRATSRRWYARHKDDCRDRVKKWRAANPDKVRQMRKVWDNKNPSRAAARRTKWKLANPDRQRDCQQRYRDRNREQINAQARAKRRQSKEVS